MTTPAAEVPEAPAPGRSRSPRRGPADLPFAFADRALALALASEREEPPWLREDRLAAFVAFDGLPVEANRLYTLYVDLRSADLFGVRPYVRTATTCMSSAVPLPEGSAGIIELREDGIAALTLDPAVAALGVTLEPLAAALARDPTRVRAELAETALPVDDKLAQLARGFWSQGVRLWVPDGVRVERPFLVRWSVGRPGRALVTRTLLTLGEDAEASIVEEQGASGRPFAGDAQALFAATTEVRLGANANLSLASIQDLPATTTAFQHRVTEVGAGANLHLALAQLGGRIVRSRIDNRLAGSGGSVEQVEIVFGGRDQLFDLTSYTRHVGQDTTGNLLSKAVLQHGSRAYMKGLISIERSARGTDSFLGEFGMVLDKQSRSVTIPSLEIEQPDCRRAGHASSVGPIDPAQLFYLMSRGITEDEARKLITLCFLEPVVARVPLEEERERLWTLLEAKWAESRGTVAA
jgi:Fe-S cluster assembly scaffold protein SufB